MDSRYITIMQETNATQWLCHFLTRYSS